MNRSFFCVALWDVRRVGVGGLRSVVAAAAERHCFTIVSARLSCCSSRLRGGCYDGAQPSSASARLMAFHRLRSSEPSSEPASLWRHKAKVNSSTELVEVLGPPGSFGRDALRRVLARNKPIVIQIFRDLRAMQALGLLTRSSPTERQPSASRRPVWQRVYYYAS